MAHGHILGFGGCVHRHLSARVFQRPRFGIVRYFRRRMRPARLIPPRPGNGAPTETPPRAVEVNREVGM
ncbi:hypothetical protein LZ30DRAFT_742094 [Colletotrichum cereale]|nr:hypothetical protein LZ30DRAFT_742094 [Colletotrichum cereale]